MVGTASRSCTDWSSPTPAGAYESLPAQVHVLIIVNAYSDCSEKSIPWMFTSSSNARHEHGYLPQNWHVEDGFACKRRRNDRGVAPHCPVDTGSSPA